MTRKSLLLCLCSECVCDLMSLKGRGGGVGGVLLGGGGGAGHWVPEEEFHWGLMGQSSSKGGICRLTKNLTPSSGGAGETWGGIRSGSGWSV